MPSRSTRSDSVAHAVRDARARLRRRRSLRRAAGMRTYFKRDEDVSFYGVDLPTVRRIAAEIGRERRTWTVADATRFCDTLIRDREFEAKCVGVLVLERWRRDFPPGLFRTARRWLRDGHCASWAAVDLVAPTLLSPLVRAHPELLGELARWPTARSLWVRRASAVTLVPLARKGEALPQAYRTARALFPDPHDLIHKATGWLLREAGKTDADRLERFLRRHGPRIPRTALRYAIERFPPARRKRLLEETRSPTLRPARATRRARGRPS